MTKGKKEDLERLYISMYDSLYTYALVILHDPLLAEDVVQEVFLIGCKKKDVLLNSKSPEGWLVKALRFEIMNIQRHKVVTINAMARYFINSLDNLMCTDALSPDVLYQDIAETEDYKLLCHVADGFLQRDIAKAKGISLSACKKRTQRARERLKKKIIF